MLKKFYNLKHLISLAGHNYQLICNPTNFRLIIKDDLHKKNMSTDKVGAIARLSLQSVYKFRITLLMLFLIIIVGLVSYTTLLPRKGFPELAFPTVILQTQYPGGSVEDVDKNVTEPMEKALENVEGIESVASKTFPGFSSIIVSFETDIDVEVGVEDIKNVFEKSLRLEQGVEPQIIALEPNSIDGENEILLAISSDEKSTLELQTKAFEVANELEELDEIAEVSVIELYEDVFNPKTGKISTEQVTFNRIGVSEGGAIKFYNSILIGVKANDKFNITDITDAIDEEINNLEKLGQLNDYEFHSVYDPGTDLKLQINSLELNARDGVIAVVIVLLLLVSWRASVVISLFIPTVMLSTFIILYLLGVSLNTISLFGLVLVLGLLVDDAIVVIENIDYQKKHGKHGIEAVKVAIQTIGRADVVGTITIILAFLPMLLITGFLGDIIRDVPITVVTALIMSLTISLTIIPLLSYIIFPDNDKKARLRFLDKTLNILGNLVLKVATQVSKFIGFYLSKKIYTFFVILVSIVLILIGLYFSSTLKFVNFPSQKDSDAIQINFAFDPTLTLEQRVAVATKVEKLVTDEYAELFEKYLYIQVGRSFFGDQVATVLIDLVPMNEREIKSPALANAISTIVQNSNIEGASIVVSELQVGGPPTEEYASKVQVYGNNLGALVKGSESIADFIKNDIDLGEYRVLDTKIDNTEVLAKFNGRRYVEVASKLSKGADDRTIAIIEQEVTKEFDSDKLLSLGLESNALETDRGFATEITRSVISAGVALLVSFGIMYFFLVTQFNSFGKAALIMMGIPFSFFGLFVGLSATNNAISFFVIIGVIALIGIVANNTIMLLDFANQEREKGNSIKESIVNAVRMRFRPLITTTFTTIAGSLPLALHDPFWESLAFTIIFGLVSSTTMVIFVFPAYYYLVENIRLKTHKLARRLFK